MTPTCTLLCLFSFGCRSYLLFTISPLQLERPLSIPLFVSLLTYFILIIPHRHAWMPFTSPSVFSMDLLFSFLLFSNANNTIYLPDFGPCLDQVPLSFDYVSLSLLSTLVHGVVITYWQGKSPKQRKRSHYTDEKYLILLNYLIACYTCSKSRCTRHMKLVRDNSCGPRSRATEHMIYVASRWDCTILLPE